MEPVPAAPSSAAAAPPDRSARVTEPPSREVGVAKSSVFNSVQVKVGFVLLLSVLASSAVLTWRGTVATSEARRVGAETELVNEATVTVTEVEKALAGSSGDLRTLRQAPPIQGYIRASGAAGGVDPNDLSSTDEIWLDRLRTLMVGYLEARPAYLEMTFVDERGQLLAVVSRSGDGFLRPKTSALGNITDETYVQSTLELTIDEVHTGPFRWDEEGGTQVRFGVPVFDERSGESRGLLSIAVSTDDVLGPIAASVSGDGEWSMLVDADGWILAHRDIDKIISGQTLADEFGPEVDARVAAGGRGVIKTNGMVIGFDEASLVDGLDGGPGASLMALRIVDEAQVFGAARQFRNTSIVIAALVLLVTVTVAVLLVGHLIGRPLRRIAEQAGRIAAGDLSVEPLGIRRGDEVGVLAASFDEMTGTLRSVGAQARRIADGDLSVTGSERSIPGQLGASFRTMVSSLEAMVGRLKESSGRLTSAADGLTSVSGQLDEGTDRTSTQATTVSTAVSQLDGSIREIATSANEASMVTSEAVDAAKRNSTTMAELESSSAEIGRVIDVISDIAEQTNLLALNATIEAARAGEMGKGFAVVANEVKGLANQTATATADIAQLVDTMQRSTAGAVLANGQIGETIGRIDEISTSIASAVEEQSTTSSSIAASVADLAAAANATRDSTDHTGRAAADMDDLADELRRVVSRYR